VGYGVVFVVWRISEATTLSELSIWIIFIRSLLGFLICWALDAAFRYKAYFYQKRKHRWEPGCSSYGRPPCLGARKMRDWKTKGPLKPYSRGILDFDHIQLPFLDFLWGRIMITFPFIVTVCWEIFSFGSYRASFLRVYTRRFFEKIGILTPLNLPDPSESFAKFILGTSVSIFYQGPLRHQKDGSVEATFIIEDAAIPKGVGGVEYGRFEAVVDVSKKRLVRASYTPMVGPHGLLKRETIQMTPADALLFIVSESISHVHSQMHSWANWGVSTCSRNPFVARMSKISVIYNHMGSEGAPCAIDLIHTVGITKFVNYETWNGKRDLYSHGEQRKGLLSRVQRHPNHHANIADLMPYSPFISFVINVRNFFMQEFKKYENTDFAGIHPEALFLGTVLHGIEHENAFLVDINEFRATMEYFAPLEEVVVTVHQLADGCHWFPFPYKFKDAPHPFYQAVYKFAKSLDPNMADLMDACIIR